MLAESSLYSALQAEAQRATSARPPRKPFSYVDLTGEETLPIWLPQATLASARQDVDVGGPGDLQQFLRALKAATAAPRAFKNIGQWHAAYRRYFVAAVATGHMSMVAAFQHADQVDRIADEERAAGRSPLLALVYDELARKEWERP